jgi:hypothetical protein
MYKNSESVGKGWKSTGVSREDLFLTTKRTYDYRWIEAGVLISYYWGIVGSSDPRAGLEEELKL